MIVVSDTSPPCYLILIGQIDLLPQLYGQVVIPEAVRDELAVERTSDAVQHQIHTGRTEASASAWASL